MEDVGKPSEVVCELKSEVESFKRKLEVYVSENTAADLHSHLKKTFWSSKHVFDDIVDCLHNRNGNH